MSGEKIGMQDVLDNCLNTWIKHFKKEGYPELAESIAEIRERHGNTKLGKEEMITYLKKQSSDNKSEAYLETMAEDINYKLVNSKKFIEKMEEKA